MNIRELLERNSEALTEAVLTELGLTKEEAVVKLANQLGVNMEQFAPKPEYSGKPVTVTEEQVALLRQAGELQRQIFG